AMDRALASDNAAFSGPVHFDQPALRNHETFVIYVPASYGKPTSDAERRHDLVGFVFAPIAMDDLTAKVIGNDMVARIYIGAGPGKKLLYSTPNKLPEGYEPRNPFRESPTIERQQFSFEIDPTPAFDAASDRWLIPLTTIAGIVVSVVLFL